MIFLCTYQENQYQILFKGFSSSLFNSKLDFDASPGPIYHIKVVAKDNGAISQSSSVDVMISTVNVNDEKPAIAAPGVSVLRDNVPRNFILTRLKATDKDGDNVKFYFSRKCLCKNFCHSQFILKTIFTTLFPVHKGFLTLSKMFIFQKT